MAPAQTVADSTFNNNSAPCMLGACLPVRREFIPEPTCLTWKVVASSTFDTDGERTLAVITRKNTDLPFSPDPGLPRRPGIVRAAAFAVAGLASAEVTPEARDLLIAHFSGVPLALTR